MSFRTGNALVCSGYADYNGESVKMGQLTQVWRDFLIDGVVQPELCENGASEGYRMMVLLRIHGWRCFIGAENRHHLSF